MPATNAEIYGTISTHYQGCLLPPEFVIFGESTDQGYGFSLVDTTGNGARIQPLFCCEGDAYGLQSNRGIFVNERTLGKVYRAARDRIEGVYGRRGIVVLQRVEEAGRYLNSLQEALDRNDPGWGLRAMRVFEKRPYLVLCHLKDIQSEVWPLGPRAKPGPLARITLFTSPLVTEAVAPLYPSR